MDVDLCNGVPGDGTRVCHVDRNFDFASADAGWGERILEAAGRLIAVRGLADSPNKAIVEAAWVDQASINYHFGSRNGLYQGTLIDPSARYSAGETAGDRSRNASPSEKIRALIEEMVEAIYANGSWHAGVFAQEVLSRSANMQSVMTRDVLPKIAFVRKFISSYTTIPDDHPMLAQRLISFVAPCLVLMIAGKGIAGPLKEVLACRGEA